MKTMKYYQYGLSILFFILTVAVSGCKKGDVGPSIDDYFLNYQIKEVPVTQDYVVGAIYYWFSSFNPNITEVPVVGKYSMPNGVIDPSIMSQHIDQASSGGIDYFLFQIRSYNVDNGNYKHDSTLISTFIQQNTSGKMKFAVYYTFNPGNYGVSTSVNMESDSTKLNRFFDDIVRLAPLFKNASYQKVNGKTLLYINNSNQLYSADDPSIYKTLRSKLSALGFDMYIVGYQERWSPPARYVIRFRNCVDAVYEQSYSSQVNSWDRWYLLPQEMDQNWEYSRKYFADSLSISFIPNISPAYNWNINTPTSVNPNYPRTDSGKMYRTLCNVAKMNADNTTRLIVIDSWNDWAEDMQLEPAESYGNLYLDITKQEFKK